MNILFMFLATMGFVFGVFCLVMLIFIDTQNKGLENKQSIRLDVHNREIASLYKYANVLENRIDVLEFKEKAKGDMYIIDKKDCCLFYYDITVSWLNGDFVCRSNIKERAADIKINGKYIEFISFNKSYNDKVLYADGDKLVNMDIDVYKKAYPERFTQKEKTEVKENA